MRRTRPLKEKFDEKWEHNKNNNCWEWTAYRNPAGYGMIHTGGRKGSAKLAHRVSWELHIGDIPSSDERHGTLVCHSCDNPRCVNPDHLFLGTNAINMRDKVNKGRQPRGEQLSISKLREVDVLNIRAIRKYVESASMQKLADIYGISIGAMWKIIHNETWVHI